MLLGNASARHACRILALMFFSTAFGACPSAQQKAPAGRDVARGPASPAAAATAEADVTTAAFGDWVLRCVKQSDDAKAGRACEVVHQVAVEGQTGPILQLAIGGVKSEQRQLVIVLPANVLLTRAPEIVLQNQTATLTTIWRRCLPGACFADVDYSDKMSLQDQGGVVRFTDASNRAVEVPFSTRGLRQALDALSKS